MFRAKDADDLGDPTGGVSFSCIFIYPLHIFK